jgi:RimJ/RimL family protein N-acetyltransferase
MRAATVTLAGRYATLTPLSLDDVAGLVSAASGDRSTFGWINIPDTTESMEARVHELLNELSTGTSLPFATRRTDGGEIVGMTRFLNLRWWFGRPFPDAAEIGGTFLNAAAQRTPVNTEAKLLMMSHAFDVWEVQRLDFKTDERNERSRRAIERVGGQFEGVLRNWQPSMVDGEDGATRSTALYSVLPSEWPAAREGLIARLR